MNLTGGGEYKLLFLLPVFPDTARVLLLDAGSAALGDRLSSMGIECVRGSIRDLGPGGEEFDIIVAGRMPEGRMETERFVRSADGLLAEKGWLVVVSPNRFGYRRFARRKEGGSSLRAMTGMMRRMGFSDIHVYSPVPDSENPSAFISLRGTSSFEFLLGQFPDFMSVRSGPLRSIISLLVRTGIFRYVQNHYAVVAGGRKRG